MKLSEHALDWIARRFNVPHEAMRMFRAANAVSGIQKETLPSELIPLNTTQFARGLLNFTLLQSIQDWVFPFWAERQFDHRDASFVPRSHLGLSMNVTHRNWTAVGSMECNVEPIVDPRGLVTPFWNGWSIDVLLSVNGNGFFPSRSTTVLQELVDNCPVVNTTFDVDGILVILTTFVVRTTLVHRVVVRNGTPASMECALGIALRPFNPEGVALVNELAYDATGMNLKVNGSANVHYSVKPNRVYCGNYETGDSMMMVAAGDPCKQSSATRCSVGLANTVAVYDLVLPAEGVRSIEVACVLTEPLIRWDHGSRGTPPERPWQEVLSGGTSLVTPDARINAIVRASVCTLLLLVDKDSITPGPFTYHQFWFRDAAYMIAALERWGYSKVTEPVIRAFTRYQKSDGYFCSQQGEWDSNGQALWTAWHHFNHSGNRALLRDLFDSMTRGFDWIDTKRLLGKQHVGKPWFGLMPRGLSAEHLGLVDHYFWDNFWSCAGVKAYIGMCDALGLHNESERAALCLAAFRTDIEVAIGLVQEQFRTAAITASPLRGVDCGMIGSLCAWYPLQLFPVNDPRLMPSLKILSEQFSHDGMFFQRFIHSGANAYLSLQLAHAWLFAGERHRFWTQLHSVLDHATPTWNFPEAIHPITHGGVMGDGHHGWAAAEIVLALRDAFVYETARKSNDEYDLVLLSGIPEAWFAPDQSFSLTNAPLSGASIDMAVSSSQTSTEIAVTWHQRLERLRVKMLLVLPFIGREESWRGNAKPTTSVVNDMTMVEIPAGSFALVLKR